MNSEESSTPVIPATADRVRLSPYVNERFPNWEEILSARDVARLTRRPRWVVLSLALLGRLPRKRRFRGRRIGWLRSDVIQWLSKDLRASPYARGPAQAVHGRIARQTSFPFDGIESLTRRSRRRATRRGIGR